MLPATETLSLYRGDSVRLVRRFRPVLEDGTLGAYFDLTGCTPKAQIRASSTATTVLVEFTATLDDQTDPDTVGGVILEIVAGDTSALPDGAQWDMQLTHADGFVRTYIAGPVVSTGQVTR